MEQFPASRSNERFLGFGKGSDYMSGEVNHGRDTK